MNYEETDKEFIRLEAYLDMYDLIADADLDEIVLLEMTTIIANEANKINWISVRRRLTEGKKLAEDIKAATDKKK